jgi:aspartyl-tRNA(Asn)/glutamyl-tRNA(Gln) amidotransferase subunit C
MSKVSLLVQLLTFSHLTHLLTYSFTVNTETLRGLAHLARLEFDPAREEQMLKDLNGILDWVAQLEKVDTEGVAPLVHLSHEINVLRDDVAHNTISHQDGLKNAPRKDTDYFRVPKVLD